MEERTCSVCKVTKPIVEFNLRNEVTGRRETLCKACKRAYTKSHYRKNKDAYKRRAKGHSRKVREENGRKLAEYLRSHPCIDCGEADIIVLEFDHLQGKRKAVGAMVNGCYGWETILLEIAKCEVRCSNCHKRRTARTRGWKWKV